MKIGVRKNKTLSVKNNLFLGRGKKFIFFADSTYLGKIQYITYSNQLT